MRDDGGEDGHGAAKDIDQWVSYYEFDHLRGCTVRLDLCLPCFGCLHAR